MEKSKVDKSKKELEEAKAKTNNVAAKKAIEDKQRQLGKDVCK